MKKKEPVQTILARAAKELPDLPRVGAKTRIFLGVRRDGKSTMVAGTDDVPHECQVMGYSLCIGQKSANDHSIGAYDLLIHVQLSSPIEGSRWTDAHFDCLEIFNPLAKRRRMSQQLSSR